MKFKLMWCYVLNILSVEVKVWECGKIKFGLWLVRLS